MSKAGHPAKYKSTDDMAQKINEYFESRKPEYAIGDDGKILTTRNGPVVVNINAPSLSGLALFLGYASRQSIYDNEKDEKFSYILKCARSRVEEWVYQHSVSGDVPPAVGIFILKQFGYTDSQAVNMTHNGALTIIRDDID